MRILRFLFVLLGFLAIFVALVALAAEAVSFVNEGKPFAKPLGELWAKNHIASYQAVQVGIERHLGLPWLWGGIVQPLLERTPLVTAGAFAVLGIVLLLIARRFRRRG